MDGVLRRPALLLVLVPALGAAQSFDIVSSGGTSGPDQVLRFDYASPTQYALATVFSDTPGLATPVDAVRTPRGTYLVSDQINNAVYEYTASGTRLSTVVGAAQGLSNLRGIALQNGRLYVTVGGGTLQGTVQSYALTDSGAGYVASDARTFASLGSTASPWCVAFNGAKAYVSDSSSNNVLRFNLDGTADGTYVTGGTGVLRFPQQVSFAGGGALVAGFSPPTGLYGYDLSGTRTGAYALNTGARGVALLDDGRILWTGGTRLGLLDPTTGVSTDLYNSATYSFRFIERVSPVPEPTSLLALAFGALALRRRRAA